jgi:hypothetical protein
LVTWREDEPKDKDGINTVNRSNPDLADFSDEQLAKMGADSYQSRSICFNSICDSDWRTVDPLGARAAAYIARLHDQSDQ